MRRKISFSWFLFYLQLTFVGIFILVLCAYSISAGQQDFLERGMYSEQVKGVQLSSQYLKSVKGEIVDFQLSKLPSEKKYMLCKYLSDDSEETIRGIYETADIFDFAAYLETGRFFTETDFQEKTPAAVVGTDLLERTYLKDGVRYYGYSGQEYEVVGVFRETSKMLDHTVYLNLACLLDTMDNYGLYYVDASDSQTVDTVISAIKTSAQGKYTVMDAVYEAPGTQTGLNTMLNTMILCAVLSAFLNLIATAAFFVARQRYSVAIRRLCGMTKKDILSVYGKKTGLLILCVLASVTALTLAGRGHLGFFFQMENLAPVHYLVTGAALLALGTAVVFQITRLACGVDISGTLKGR